MKYFILICLALLTFSCGPKRMKCYGRRCVEAKPLVTKNDPSALPS